MEEDKKELKKGFFKKVYYSIFKLEKYGEMSAEGVGRAVKYLLKLSLILAIIISLGTLYQVNQLAKKGVDFLENQVGEFTYKDGNLKLENNEPIIAPSKGKFDSDACYKPTAIYDKDEKKWMIWYNGRTGNEEYIGLYFYYDCKK